MADTKNSTGVAHTTRTRPFSCTQTSTSSSLGSLPIMSESSTFAASFLGAFEGAVSVLLALAVGYHVAQIGIVDDKTVHRISRLCTSVFLPCLIVVQMGPELTVSNISKLWIIPVWGLLSTAFAHLLGWVAQACFRTRSWVIVAAGRPNTSALPLLLLESLSSTGVLRMLATDGESISDTLRRAKSLILLNVVLQQTITFQLAPSLLERDCKLDGKRSGRDEEEVSDEDSDSSRSILKPENEHRSHITPVVQDAERVGLLQDSDQASHSYGTNDETRYAEALGPIIDQPNLHWPRRLKNIEKPLKMVISSMSPPLIGAIVGLVIGVSALTPRASSRSHICDLQITPVFHSIFFEPESGVYTSVTQTAKNLGNLLYVHPRPWCVCTDGEVPQRGVADVHRWCTASPCPQCTSWICAYCVRIICALPDHACSQPAVRVGDCR